MPSGNVNVVPDGTVLPAIIGPAEGAESSSAAGASATGEPPPPPPQLLNSAANATTETAAIKFRGILEGHSRVSPDIMAQSDSR